jgi:hypothetical protein
MLRTLNNTIPTLLVHAAMPPSYWVEALSAAVFLLNRRPSLSINNGIPYHLLHHKMPDYSMLRVFGCLCYPNLSATTPHKLSPRSTACVFLGYSPSEKVYWCLDISTRKIIISRHVIFYETHFPFVASKPHSDSFDFLLQDILPAPPLSTSDTEAMTPLEDVIDAGDTVGLDLAILWQGAARRVPLGASPRPPAPSTGSVAAPAAAASRTVAPPPLRVYTRRPRPTPPAAAAPTAAAAAPVAAPPVPAPPSRETRSETGSLPPPIQ